MRPLYPSLRWALRSCLALGLAACTSPYLPDSISSPPSYLTADGFINAAGVSTITLAHTYSIASASAPPPETKATAYIEEEGGPRYLLREAPTGTYTSDALTLNLAKRYRLHLNTVTGKEYASDYVPAKLTPPVDAVDWTATDTGLNIAVSSHDATRATQYYRWEYNETWEIGSPYFPDVEYFNGAIRRITVPYPIVCWTTVHSTTIQLAKTTALSQDVVANFSVRKYPTNAYQLLRKYSILVQEHALTQDEYNYWELLRQNTESLGTLFDPQPVQLTGNLHCLSNSSDVALGYIGVHSLSEKRIFISRAQLPTTWRPLTNYESCIPPDTVRLDNLLLFANKLLVPINAAYAGGSLIGYTAAKPDCIDCRLRGTSVKPSFWQ